MTQNEHVYVLCCRPEETGEAVSSENVRTVEGYVVLNFEVASFSSFRDIQKIQFVTAAEAAAEAAGIDDSIKRKRIPV